MKYGLKNAPALVVAALFVTAAALPAQPPRNGSSGEPASPLVSPDPPAWEDRSSSKAAGEGFEAVEVQRIVKDLSRDASVDEVGLALYELLPQIYRATGADLPVVGEALKALGRQPSAVDALEIQLEQLPAEAFEKRLTVVGILGELRRADALAPLHEVVWAPLPAAESTAEALTERDLEEMIQAKAVQGLAYVATPIADEAVRDVIVHHDSLHVRVSAIDAYMWNHGDSRKTADELYALLPAEMHPFVERPRFESGMDPEKFSRALQDWREKWAVEPELASETEADHQGVAK
jgi:hypothetical protein